MYQLYKYENIHITINKIFFNQLTKDGSISVSNVGWFLSTALKQRSVASAKFSWHKNAHGSKQESKCSLSDKSHDSLYDKEWLSKLHNY